MDRKKSAATIRREIAEVLGAPPGAHAEPRLPSSCSTCGRSAGAPYRRMVAGKIVEGCVDEFHTGHLHGSSLEWHTSRDGRTIRRRTAEDLSAQVGHPMRGYGLPGKLKLVGENKPVR